MRRKDDHAPEFKAKAALVAIQGDPTMAELVNKFDVHAKQISDWKKQLLSCTSRHWLDLPKNGFLHDRLGVGYCLISHSF